MKTNDLIEEAIKDEFISKYGKNPEKLYCDGMLWALNFCNKQVQLEAVKQDGDAIRYIKEPTERVQLEAAKQDGDAIRYIKEPSEKVQLYILQTNIDLVKVISNPSDKLINRFLNLIPFK